MNYTKAAFQAKVRERLGRALIAFYKARLSSKNNQIRYVRYWLKESRTLLKLGLSATLLHANDFKDGVQVYAKVEKRLREQDQYYQKAAERMLVEDYGFTELVHPLDKRDSAAFWRRVDRIKQYYLIS